MSNDVLTFLIIKDQGWWSGQCMNYDFCTQAKTLDGLVIEIQRQIDLYVHLATNDGKKPFEGMTQPPPAYNEYFNKSKLWMSFRYEPVPPMIAGKERG